MQYQLNLKTHNKSDMQSKKLFRREADIFGNDVKNIRGDGERGFQPLQAIFPDINFYWQSSPFTFHNKIIDSAIKTLRNALGVNSGHMWNGNHDKTIQQLVAYYNNTYHRNIGMTPYEMAIDENLEWKYIRQKTAELSLARRKQFTTGILSYKPGDRLVVHLDYSKTTNKFIKRRRTFDRTATFIKYVNGNAMVKLDDSIDGKYNIEVPVYFTKRLEQGKDLNRMLS